jgi:hypothetical protein
MAKTKVEPFPITFEDTDRGPDPKKVKTRTKVVVKERKKPRFQALNDDMIWIAEQDIHRMKRELELSGRPLSPADHTRFIKTSEQLRKLRLTDAELNKMQDPGKLDDALIDEEFEERCEALGLDPNAVREALGL